MATAEGTAPRLCAFAGCTIDTDLYRVVGLQKQGFAAHAAVEAAQCHVQAKAEEVAVVEVAHAVVHPGWKGVEVNVYKDGGWGTRQRR